MPVAFRAKTSRGGAGMTITLNPRKIAEQIAHQAGLVGEMVEAELVSGVGGIVSRATERVRDFTPPSTGDRESTGLRDSWRSTGGRQPDGSLTYRIFNAQAVGTEGPLSGRGRRDRLRALLALEFGSAPHEIAPRSRSGLRRRFLRFRWGARVVFARSVMHPGNRPYAMVRLTRNLAQQELAMELKLLRQAALRAWRPQRS